MAGLEASDNRRLPEAVTKGAISVLAKHHKAFPESFWKGDPVLRRT
jgi:hypothetical protein